MESTELNEAYKLATQSKSEVDSLLQTIEQSNEMPSVAIQQRISSLTKELTNAIEIMKSNIPKLSARSKPLWDSRVTRLHEDLNLIRIACDRRLGLLFKSQREQEERDMLFGRSRSKEPKGEGATLLAESSSLRGSHNMMDNITDQSKVILDRLVGQNTTLKSARGKMYDLINSAGISGGILNTIGSREYADAIIVYGCMALTILVFVLLWWFIR